jgi:hypothetical protein
VEVELVFLSHLHVLDVEKQAALADAHFRSPLLHAHLAVRLHPHLVPSLHHLQHLPNCALATLALLAPRPRLPRRPLLAVNSLFSRSLHLRQ